MCPGSLNHVFLPDGHVKKYRGPLPSYLEVMTQLAEGLYYIHSLNLVHRDIKPHNVLIWVHPDGQSVVMKWADFGLSKPVSNRGTYTMTDAQGTINWMSPELLGIFYYLPDHQIENAAGDEGLQGDEAIGHRGHVQSDVFATGCVFAYLLLGGRHPYGSPFTEVPGRIYNGNIFHLEGELSFAYKAPIGLLYYHKYIRL